MEDHEEEHEIIKEEQVFSCDRLLSIRFNQHNDCFCYGNERGFAVYNCEPLKEIVRQDLRGGVGIADMQFKTKLGIVGGGNSPWQPKNKLLIWDCNSKKSIEEIAYKNKKDDRKDDTCGDRFNVLNVRLRADIIVVVLLQKIYVYRLETLKSMHCIETVANPMGLCAISQTPGSLVMAYPASGKGEVLVEHIFPSPLRKKQLFAHESELSCIALTSDGSIAATASRKGTIIRLFNTLNGTLLQEFRRGAERVHISCIAFSPDAQWLAVSSQKGTIHVFSIQTSKPEEGRSIFSKVRGVFQNSLSTSFSQFRLPEGASDSVVAFGAQKHTLLIVTARATFYKCRFPIQGGEMLQLERSKLT